MKPQTLLLFYAPFLIASLAQAAPWQDELPGEILRKIFSDLHNIPLDIRPQGMHKDHWFQMVLQRHVQVDGNWMWWDDVLAEKQNAPVVEDCVNVNFILANLPAWDEETKEAALGGREPSYLKTILSLTAAKVHRFISSKGLSQTTKGELGRHAYSTLFAMRSYHSAAWRAAFRVGGDEAYGASWKVAMDAAKKSTMDAAEQAGLHAAREAAWDAVKNTGVNPRGMPAYRYAEKCVLIHFGKNAESILMAAYNAAFVRTPAAHENNIFASLGAWRDFKEKYFSELTPEQFHFLKPWLDELDLITDKIDNSRKRTKDPEFEGGQDDQARPIKRCKM